jgi:hypothetical protein
MGSRRFSMPGIFATLFLVVLFDNAYGFTHGPLLLNSMGNTHLGYQKFSRVSQISISRLKMTSTGSLQLTSNEDTKIGPHIKIGKKGAVLNAWGFWVMFYSVFIALFGYAYLKIRIVLGALTLGLLKPKAEHCCWIMHAWCKLVLWLGFSSPEVSKTPDSHGVAV